MQNNLNLIFFFFYTLSPINITFVPFFVRLQLNHSILSWKDEILAQKFSEISWNEFLGRLKTIVLALTRMGLKTIFRRRTSEQKSEMAPTEQKTASKMRPKPPKTCSKSTEPLPTASGTNRSAWLVFFCACLNHIGHLTFDIFRRFCFVFLLNPNCLFDALLVPITMVYNICVTKQSYEDKEKWDWFIFSICAAKVF